MAVNDFSKFEILNGSNVDTYKIKDSSAVASIDSSKDSLVVTGRDGSTTDVPLVYICSDTITNTPDGFVYRQTNNGIGKNKENATITRYVGNSLVWNQLVVNGDFSDGTDSWSVDTNIGSLSIENNIATITRISNDLLQLRSSSFNITKNHIYYLTRDVWANTACTMRGGVVSVVDNGIQVSAQTWTKFSTYFTNTSDYTSSRINIYPDISDVTEHRVKNVMLFDLTLMFGAGKEPSTVEEFERMYPEPYYPYNAGTLINNRTKAIESVGFNLWDEEWENGYYIRTDGTKANDNQRIRCKNLIRVVPNTSYYFNVVGTYSNKGHGAIFYDINKNFISGQDVGYGIFITPSNAYYMAFAMFTTYDSIYHNDICINLSDASRNGTYEPYKKYDLPINLNSFRVKDSNGNIITIEGGLKSAGSVYDEITSDGKYIKRIGSVDLGTATWGWNSYGNAFGGTFPNSVSKPKAYGQCVCEKNYTFITTIGGIPDLYMCPTDNGIVIRDDSFSQDTVAFGQSVTGVILHYQLATSEVYDLVEVIPNNYPVDDLGTEARIAPLIDGVPGSPFKGDIDYYRSSDSYLHTVTVNGFPAHVNNGTAEIELPLEQLSGHIYDKSKDSLAEGVIEGKGNINTASGVRSHAEGVGTVASGKASHTEGNGTTASAENAHAEGLNTQATKKAAHAEGNATVASATYAHAEGRETEATAESAHAEGYKTDATGKYSHAEGLESNANGKGSHAEGNNTHTDVNADFAHAEGNDTGANGKYSHAEGTETQSNGQASHAEGDRTYSSGDAAHAEGSRTYAYSKYGHAEGQQTQVFNDADAAHAEGYVTEAHGKYSHTEGNNTYSIGDDSHAEGFHSNAVGVASHAEGYGSLVNPGPTFSWTTDSTTLTASQESSNLHVGDVLYYYNKARKITSIDGTTIYIDSTFGGSATNATLEIMKCVAYGEASHAEGNRTYAVGDYSHAEGSNVKTVNEAEHGEGIYNRPIPGVSRHTVGIGTGESNRKNAHLITTDGKHYIPGIGGYDGTLTSLTGIQDVASVFGNYLPLAGGTMTGAAPISWNGNNKIAINWRLGHASYNSKVLYSTPGNEALIFANKSAVTSFIFKTGLDLTDGYAWTSITTPTVQMKNQSLYVNKGIDNGVTPTHTFYAAGNSRVDGNLTVSNNSTNNGCTMTYNTTTKSLDFVF